MKDEPSISSLATVNLPKETREDGEIYLTPKQVFEDAESKSGRDMFERETGMDYCKPGKAD